MVQEIFRNRKCNCPDKDLIKLKNEISTIGIYECPHCKLIIHAIEETKIVNVKT